MYKVQKVQNTEYRKYKLQKKYKKYTIQNKINTESLKYINYKVQEITKMHKTKFFKPILYIPTHTKVNKKKQ